MILHTILLLVACISFHTTTSCPDENIIISLLQNTTTDHHLVNTTSPHANEIQKALLSAYALDPSLQSVPAFSYPRTLEFHQYTKESDDLAQRYGGTRGSFKQYLFPWDADMAFITDKFQKNGPDASCIPPIIGIRLDVVFPM